MNNEIESCAICLCDMLIDKDDIYTLEKCNHKFHSKCLLEMYINSQYKFCPLCRQNIYSSGITNEIRNQKKLEELHKLFAEKKVNKIIKKEFKKYKEAEEKIKDFNLEIKEVQQEINKFHRKNSSDVSKIHKLEQQLRDVKDLKKCVRVNIFDVPWGHPYKYQIFMKTNKYKELMEKFNSETIKEVEIFISNMQKEYDETKEKIEYNKLEELRKKCRELIGKVEKIIYKKEYLEQKLLGIPNNLLT